VSCSLYFHVYSKHVDETLLGQDEILAVDHGLAAEEEEVTVTAVMIATILRHHTIRIPSILGNQNQQTMEPTMQALPEVVNNRIKAGDLGR